MIVDDSDRGWQNMILKMIEHDRISQNVIEDDRNDRDHDRM